MLHVALLLERLRSDGEPGQRLGQEVMEAMFEALDDDMREQGVGDLTVPKKMHKAAGAFLGRAGVYAAALASPDEAALVMALAKNVYGSEAPPGAAERLAVYVRAVARSLAAQPSDAIFAGDVRFTASAPAS
jgi:cytochrome b pre-mRNA-processing protein 3